MTNQVVTLYNSCVDDLIWMDGAHLGDSFSDMLLDFIDHHGDRTLQPNLYYSGMVDFTPDCRFCDWVKSCTFVEKQRFVRALETFQDGPRWSDIRYTTSKHQLWCGLLAITHDMCSQSKIYQPDDIWTLDLHSFPGDLLFSWRYLEPEIVESATLAQVKSLLKRESGDDVMAIIRELVLGLMDGRLCWK